MQKDINVDHIAFVKTVSRHITRPDLCGPLVMGVNVYITLLEYERVFL